MSITIFLLDIKTSKYVTLTSSMRRFAAIFIGIFLCTGAFCLVRELVYQSSATIHNTGLHSWKRHRELRLFQQEEDVFKKASLLFAYAERRFAEAEIAADGLYEASLVPKAGAQGLAFGLEDNQFAQLLVESNTFLVKGMHLIDQVDDADDRSILLKNAQTIVQKQRTALDALSASILEEEIAVAALVEALIGLQQKYADALYNALVKGGETHFVFQVERVGLTLEVDEVYRAQGSAWNK